MMSPATSPIHPSLDTSASDHYYDGILLNPEDNATSSTYQNRDDSETTFLMQSNYLSSEHQHSNNNTNIAHGNSTTTTTTRRRTTAATIALAQKQQQNLHQYYVTTNSASFSPPYLPIVPEYSSSPAHTVGHGTATSTASPDDKYKPTTATNCPHFLTSTCRDCFRHKVDPYQETTTHYRDDFNDNSYSCTFGTSEDSGTWMNTQDQAGTILAVTVWFLLGYSAVTMSFLAETGGIPPILSYAYCLFTALALASHAKTTFTDPGAVPQAAIPIEATAASSHSMCSQCQTFKPPFSHHCRICNRCISRMDHHCPWMNNCIGSGNLKHFVLFLIYTWVCSTMALLLLGWNYFVCDDVDCEFTPVLTQLVRLMTVLCTGSFMFTSSMIMNVCYGIMTGIGTIDRLKKKATSTMMESDEEPIELVDVFGIGPCYTWLLHMDPIFEDFDRVMGYSTPQRLLRGQLRVENPYYNINHKSIELSNSNNSNIHHFLV